MLEKRYAKVENPGQVVFGYEPENGYA